MPVDLDFEHFKYFILSVRDGSNAPQSIKARAIGFISIGDLYQFLTNKPYRTKITKKETKDFERWKFKVWRPFSKTLTKEDYESLQIEPMIGREGFIATFGIKDQNAYRK